MRTKHRKQQDPIGRPKADIQTQAALQRGPAALSKAGTHLTAEEWATCINASCRRSVEALIQAGLELLSAKQDLDHGDWLRLFDLRLVDIHQREAERLMQVARHKVLANPTKWSNLPASLQALCALSRVEPRVLDVALISGEISPSTTIKKAKEFGAKHLQITRDAEGVINGDAQPQAGKKSRRQKLSTSRKALNAPSRPCAARFATAPRNSAGLWASRFNTPPCCFSRLRIQRTILLDW
jgi:hypothetical protein